MDEDLEILVYNQRRELMAASESESDLEFAFRLQLQEAMAASLSLQPSTSAPPLPPLPPAPFPLPDKDEVDDASVSQLLTLQTLELERFHQECRDTKLCQAEMRRATEDLRFRVYDNKFAREISEIPDHEWKEYGDNVEKPIEFGLEEEVANPFKLYFKGMSCDVPSNGSVAHISAVGVAICDPENKLVLKMQKPLLGSVFGREFIETKALIEGLNAVLSLGIKSVDVFCDNVPLYNHITGRWHIKQRKIANIINQAALLQRKIGRCNMYLLPRQHVQYVIKLANDAIDSQVTKGAARGCCSNVMKENCTICLEDTESSEMFVVDNCLHRFCFSCMKQHVEVKLLYGILPECPHEGCHTKLNVESSKKFLPPKLIEILTQRIKESSIPPTEKVYCPYPKCSALMSRNEAISPVIHSSSKQQISVSGLRKCIKCGGGFCINCKVPWHDEMSCDKYRTYHPHHLAEEAKVQSLARQKLWRQCVKCSHMIELAEGCFHIMCRCGYEFCYTCGAEWRNKKATCRCPLWDENHILYNEDEVQEDLLDSDDDYEEESDYEDDYHYGYDQ